MHSDILATLLAGHELSHQEAQCLAEVLLMPSVEDAVKAALLEALAHKGESPAEIATLVEAFLKHARDPGIDLDALPGPAIDVCGTGGDRLHLFNVSTTAMFIAAAAGCCVIKHGNRSISSQSGSADVLEALGIAIEQSPALARHCLQESRLCFLFAPAYHPAFAQLAPLRKALAARGLRTVFNLLGPLLNPARPHYQLIGVSQAKLLEAFADIGRRLGRRQVTIACGSTDDGRSLDEISLMGQTQLAMSTASGQLVFQTIQPEEFGLTRARLEELVGGSPKHNAELLVAILEGKERSARSDMALLNAAVAIFTAGLAPSLHHAYVRACDVLASGAALHQLELLRRASQCQCGDL